MFNGNFALYAGDPALRGLGNLTLENLQEAMRRRVPERLLNAAASSYRVSNVRYKPRQKLVIGLVSDVGGNPVGMRVFPTRKLSNRLEKARSEHPDHTFLVPEADAIVWVFPAERKLKLGAVANRRLLSDLLSAQRGTVLRRIDLIHFVPEHSYTARVVADDLDGSPRCEFLKIYYNDDGARTARTMAQLAVQAKNKAIALPSSISYHPEHSMLLQSELSRDLSAVLSMQRAAAALADFHGLHAVAVPKIDDASGDKIDATVALVEAVFPVHTDAVARIGRLLKEKLVATTAAPSCLLHGDAHLGNLFPLTDGKTGIIDLDGVAMGPPEQDLASFFAFKLWVAIREQKSPAALIRTYPDFIAAYNEVAVNPVSFERACAVLAEKMLTERIYRGISRGKLAHETELTVFLEIASNYLALAERIDV